MEALKQNVEMKGLKVRSTEPSVAIPFLLVHEAA